MEILRIAIEEVLQNHEPAESMADAIEARVMKELRTGKAAMIQNKVDTYLQIYACMMDESTERRLPVEVQNAATTVFIAMKSGR